MQQKTSNLSYIIMVACLIFGLAIVIWYIKKPEPISKNKITNTLIAVGSNAVKDTTRNSYSENIGIASDSVSPSVNQYGRNNTQLGVGFATPQMILDHSHIPGKKKKHKKIYYAGTLIDVGSVALGTATTDPVITGDTVVWGGTLVKDTNIAGTGSFVKDTTQPRIIQVIENQGDTPVNYLLYPSGMVFKDQRFIGLLNKTRINFIAVDTGQVIDYGHVMYSVFDSSIRQFKFVRDSSNRNILYNHVVFFVMGYEYRVHRWDVPGGKEVPGNWNGWWQHLIYTDEYEKPMSFKTQIITFWYPNGIER